MHTYPKNYWYHKEGPRRAHKLFPSSSFSSSHEVAIGPVTVHVLPLLLRCEIWYVWLPDLAGEISPLLTPPMNWKEEEMSQSKPGALCWRWQLFWAPVILKKHTMCPPLLHPSSLSHWVWTSCYLSYPKRCHSAHSQWHIDHSCWATLGTGSAVANVIQTDHWYCPHHFHSLPAPNTLCHSVYNTFVFVIGPE